MEIAPTAIEEAAEDGFKGEKSRRRNTREARSVKSKRKTQDDCHPGMH
jgi:hypothetical protein